MVRAGGKTVTSSLVIEILVIIFEYAYVCCDIYLSIYPYASVAHVSIETCRRIMNDNELWITLTCDVTTVIWMCYL